MSILTDRMREGAEENQRFMDKLLKKDKTMVTSTIYRDSEKIVIQRPCPQGGEISTIETKEQIIRDSLIELGWTPPEEKCACVSKAKERTRKAFERTRYERALKKAQSQFAEVANEIAELEIKREKIQRDILNLDDLLNG